MSVLVGVVDGGFMRVARERIHAAAQFVVGPDSAALREPPSERPLPHGECVAALVVEAAPDVRLLDARVASAAFRPTPRTVAAAIDWCVAQGARVVGLSLGVADDREVLRDACARAAARRVLLVAAAPARGAPVFPASYPHVFAVSGDARCAPGEWSALDGAPAAWGTCPDGPGGVPGGASMAAARFTGIVAGYLSGHAATERSALAVHLATFATWRGRENRRIAEIDS